MDLSLDPSFLNEEGIDLSQTSKNKDFIKMKQGR
jgi:hypothetical protein